MYKVFFLLGLFIASGLFAQNNPDNFYELYHSKNEVYEMVYEFAETHPEFVFLDTIGYSEVKKYPIIALKISDNPRVEEDEPCVMYDGLHHAREPISMEVCLKLIEKLLVGYGTDEQITEWIDETEIWIIPMINPEGWEYVVEENLSYPYWRKNFRDNNGNGIFDPQTDGVDINRNYDFNWVLGGSGDIGSWTYRGPEPFSEGEARAKRDLALAQKPSISLSYHTHGEIIIYSWSDRPEAPDQQLILSIATGIAQRIPSVTGSGTYQPTVSNCQNGFSRCWMYTVAGSLEYTVECAKEFIPAGEPALQIADQHMDAALYVLERVHDAGVTLHITDAITGDPLAAQVQIPEIYDPILTPRTSDSLHGRFDRIVLPGVYNFQITKDGYQTEIITNIEVVDGRPTPVDVQLFPKAVSTQDILLARQGGNLLINNLYPNPFSSEFTIEYTLYEDSPVRIRLSNLIGQTLMLVDHNDQRSGTHKVLIKTREAEVNLQPGLYFLVIETSNIRITKKLIKG